MPTSNTRQRKAPVRDDHPHVNLSHGELARLDSEARPEPYVYITAANHRVVFPDPFDMEWEEAERFLQDISLVSASADALAKWLSEADFAALREDRLTLRQGMILVEKVQNHYGAFFGAPGEGRSSRTS